jgi:hypothetical protein
MVTPQPVVEGAGVPAERSRARSTTSSPRTSSRRGCRLRDKLVEAQIDQKSRPCRAEPEPGRAAVPDQGRPRELLVHRARREEARLALAAKLHKTAESVFGVTTSRED